MGQSSAKEDLRRYRQGYPGQPDDMDENDMSNFYKNTLQSNPHGDYIEKIHETWYGDYELLERHHGYIQWLFPIREPGMNSEASRLQTHEIEIIKSDPKCLERLVKSFRLMLDFYGMKLKDEKTGEIERADNYKARYSHLNSSFHNYLRITRILKCLGEFGFAHLQVAWLDFWISEMYDNGLLGKCRKSLEEFWLMTIRDDAVRLERIRRIRRAKGMSQTDIDDPCDDSIVPERPPQKFTGVAAARHDDDDDDEDEDDAKADAETDDEEEEKAAQSHDDKLRHYEKLLDSSSDDDNEDNDKQADSTK